MSARTSRLTVPGRVVWDGVAVAACAALAAVSAWEVYGTPYVGAVAAAGFVIALVAVIAGAVRGWPWWGTAIAALLGYLLAVVPVTMPDALTDVSRIGRAIITGLSGAIVGWKQVLTISVPAGMYQGVLVPFFFTVALCCVVALGVMVLAPQRAPLAMAPMLLMVGYGFAFGSSSVSGSFDAAIGSVPDARRSAIALASLVVCVIWALGRARIDRSLQIGTARAATGTARIGSSSWGFAVRRHSASAGIVAIAAIGTLAFAPFGAGLGVRIVPRDSVDPIIYVQDQPSPLVDYRRSFEQPAYGTTLFVVGGAGAADRLRIATLDDYDGQTYRLAPQTRFTRQPMFQEDTITVTIAEGYRGVWVPISTAAGGAPRFIGPRAETLADAYYANVAANSAVVVTDTPGIGLLPGDAYTIAAAPSPSPELVQSLRGGESRLDPERHPMLIAWVDRQLVGRTGADFLELVDRLRERGYISHSSRQTVASQQWISALEARAGFEFHGSRPGHSAARIDELFAELIEQEQRAGAFAQPSDLVAGIGDDEQFATAVSLLAAHFGFDSRLVVGVRLGDTGADLAVPPCHDVCTGANLTVWAEVRAGDGSWVPIDATPQFEIAPITIQQGQTPPQNPTEPQEAESSVVEPPAVANDATAEESEPSAERASWLDTYLPLIIAIAVGLVGAAVLLAPLLVFPLAKGSRRRWRRHNPSTEVAMVGAWEELVDTYVDLGLEVPEGLTRAETADVLGRPVAAAVAADVDRAVFSDAAPSDQAREAAWRLVDAERRDVIRSAPLGRRLRARLTPMSLRRAARGRKRRSTPALLRKDRPRNE